MRTIGNLSPELQQTLTQCTFLIWFQTVGDAPQDWYISTHGQVNWNSHVWLAMGARVRHPITLEKLSFSLPNQSSQILSMTAANKFKRAPAKVWVMYPGASSDNAVLLMNGVISRVSNLFEDRASIDIDRYADENRLVPTKFIAPPEFNMLPPRNLELRWGNRKIVFFRPEVG